MRFIVLKINLKLLTSSLVVLLISGCGSKVSGELGETPQRLLEDESLVAQIENGSGSDDKTKAALCSKDAGKGLEAKNIKKGVTICGVKGTLVVAAADGTVPQCSAEGQEDCLPNTEFAIAEVGTLAAKVGIGQTVAGVAGTLGAELHSDCVADGIQDCVTTAAFLSADVSTALPTNIKSGVQIAGQTGTVTLPAINDVELGVTFGAGGNEFTGDFTVPNIAVVASGVNFGAGGTQFTGSASVETHIACASDGSQSCIASGAYFAATMCSSNGDTDCVVDNGTNYKAM
jgi:hypothetical protein